ncbi:MAG: LemA family protein [Spirochaetaceae bacterium]|jgi:LemA protein|nr:LemA family protein [Spirochaetaceae bacterium]
MKKGLIIALVVIGVIVLLGVGACQFYAGNYNSMVSRAEAVDAQWAQVENQYQRRYDLIPNLVETVKGYASHESEVLTQVTEARSRAGGVINVSADVLNDPQAFQRFQAAQAELSGALQRLLAVAENYPDLKANENFLALQDQLEGTENRIAVERRRFNETVQGYNSFIRQFPRMFIANMAGFTPKAYFASEPGAQNAPRVTFQ